MKWENLKCLKNELGKESPFHTYLSVWIYSSEVVKVHSGERLSLFMCGDEESVYFMTFDDDALGTYHSTWIPRICGAASSQ
jgi:hypothetical protein